MGPRHFLLGAVLLAWVGCNTYGEDLLEGSGGKDSSSTSSRATSGGGSPEEGGGGSSSTTTGTSSSTASTTAMSSSEMSSSTMASTSTGMGGSPPTGDVWINELHYDNSGADVGEGVELAGPAGLDLTGWTIVVYNGTNGMISTTGGTAQLTGTIPTQMSGMGTKWFAIEGLENGGTDPDGIALVDDNGTVIQFLSYEGTFTAAGGPAAGMLSTAIPVEETGTGLGTSLQLTGSGSSYADFTWAADVTASPDAINAGQTLQ